MVAPSIVSALLDVECPPEVWELLEVWLEVGVPLLENIVCQCSTRHLCGSPEFKQDTTVRYRIPASGGSPEPVVVTSKSLRVRRTHRMEGGGIVECFGDLGVSQTGISKLLELKDLVQHHRPPNMPVLLDYIERNDRVLSNGGE